MGILLLAYKRILIMNVLFIHPTFPGPFLQLARYLGNNKENTVIFLAQKSDIPIPDGIDLVIYKQPSPLPANVHSFCKIPAKAVMEGGNVARAIGRLLKDLKFKPDVIIGYTGQGSTLYVKDVLPEVPLIGYFDWFYRPHREDSTEERCLIRTANSPLLMSILGCDICCTPTFWQKEQFPDIFRSYIRVIHGGIDTDLFRPNHKKKLVLPRLGLDLSNCKEIVTYISKGLEPYRGFPEFMESVRLLLKRRPKCHVVICGEDKAYYGSPYAYDYKTWKRTEEEKGGYDKSRVHFVGRLDNGEYLTLLQTSTVHVYLTHWFTIISESCVEAMAAGCCIVGANVPPVRNLIVEKENGLLAKEDDPKDIAEKIELALEDKTLRTAIKKSARATILNKYSLRKCIEKQMGTIQDAIKKRVSCDL